MQIFFGTGTALITPFTKDNKVDYKALSELVNFQIRNGVEYLVLQGTTSETATLSTEEKELIKKKIIKVNNKRLPLVLGIGGNNTQMIIEQLETQDLSDFEAILSVSPYYNRPSQEGIFKHFLEIAKISPKPIIIYNVPSRTGANIEPKTVVRLAKETKNIIGIKEAAGDLIQAMKLIQSVPDNFLVISGDDMVALPMVLAGGAGVISVLAQAYPKEFTEMVKLGLKGKNKEAYKIHYKLMEAIDLIFEEGNPVGIKTLLSVLGLIENGNHVRLPLVEATGDLRKKIEHFVASFPKI